jgi:hypothetical protein
LMMGNEGNRPVLKQFVFLMFPPSSKLWRTDGRLKFLTANGHRFAAAGNTTFRPIDLPALGSFPLR